MVPIQTPILPREAQQKLQSELRSGEKLIWAAQPLPRRFWRQSIAVFLFAIPWTAFAVFWTVTAGHASPAFGLFGIPFILIGCAMLSAPLWIGRRALRTIYGITDQRAIVITGRLFGGVSVQSFMPDRLTSMTRNERADGTGDLIFEQFSQRAGSGTTTITRGFVGVERVRDVEELILKTLVSGRVRAV